MRIRNGVYTIAILSLLAVLVSPTLGKIIYVDDDAVSPGDGRSWDTAYTYLQDALADANDSDAPVEIRVGQGTYRPDRSAEQPAGTGDRNVSFVLGEGFVLKGAYAGLGAPDPNVRNVDVTKTILSGDLGGDDIMLSDARDLYDEPTRQENSRTVVEITGSTELDGVVVCAGYLLWCRGCIPFTALDDNGGGVRILGSDVVIRDCLFRDNYAEGGGGGVFSRGGEDVIVEHCMFEANGAGSGGGMVVIGGDCELRRCEFRSNWARHDGGGFGFSGVHEGTIGACLLMQCTFEGNEADSYGGAVRGGWKGPLKLDGCVLLANSAGVGGGGAANGSRGILELENCILCGNVAAERGGAIWTKGSYLTKVTNCTAYGNASVIGRFLRDESVSHDETGVVQIVHCIAWNGGEEVYNRHAATTVSYSNMQGGREQQGDPHGKLIWGPGNIEADPLFVDPGYWDPNGTPDDADDDFYVAGDYHLPSEAGRWDPNAEAWVPDAVTSPCIDAGDPNSEVAGEVWPHGGRINMGAYGGTREASLSAQPSDMFLPRVACIYWYNSELAESCQSFLEGYGCSVTLVRSEEIASHPMDDYDLILIATDTLNRAAWSDPQTVTTLTESGKPVMGLGEGGYAFFGECGLTIGSPKGAQTTFDSVQVLNSDGAFFAGPYGMTIPADGILQLFESPAQHVVLYLWPAPPETVTTFASVVGNPGYFPLAAEQGHLLWGFTEPPETMTQAGQRLFLNTVILTANGRLE